MWDVFFSYSRGDAERVRPLLEALRDAGLKVFTDEAGVAGFSGISRTIRAALADSRALLAFYSREYPERQACQWELTTAYLYGLGEGDPGGRVMVVNPERGTGHIHPVELRDTRHWPWPPPQGTSAIPALVADVQAHLARLPGPMSRTEGNAEGDPREAPRWLPGPRPTEFPRFVGRLPELWRVHSALHAHAAPLVTGSPAARAVQIRGMGGIGKSLLAREYAQRFGAAFPGGVCWLEATDAHVYREGIRRLERRLGTRDLYAYFEASGAPFLFVVDGLPGGLALGQAASFAAPHPLGRTLFTTRSRAYGALAVPVDLHTLDHDHARELAGSAELATEAAGHPQALTLLGDAVAAGQRPDALLSRLYAPGDSLFDALAGEAEEPVTVSLLRDMPTAGPEAMDVLRCAVALSPLPLSEEDAATALTAADAVPPAVARRRTAVGFAELRVRSLLSVYAAAQEGPGAERAPLRGEHAWPTDGVSWYVHPVTVHAWRHHDPAPARTEALRHAMLRTLYEAWGTATPRTRHSGRKARHMTGTGTDTPAGTPSESERMAAFDLQVELVTRIGVQELAPDAGSLREALSSLHALFGFTRDTLREYSISLAERPGEPAGTSAPGPSRAPSVQSLAHELLNGTLRPFTSTWHPRLSAYEDQRPGEVSPVAHEAAWREAPAMRADLAALRAPLHRIATDLAAISGADFGLAATG